MDDTTKEAFLDEIDKIAEKVTMFAFKDPTSYKERSKVRKNVREGMQSYGKSIKGGKYIGGGGGAALGGTGGALAGYYGGGGRVLPAVLGGLAGAAAGGVGGYFGGRHLGRKRGLKKLKEKGVESRDIKVTPQLKKNYPAVRRQVQRGGADIWAAKRGWEYSPKGREYIQKGLLSRVGSPDPHVLRRMGLPTLK
jgi:hypothetical protein